MGHLLIASCLFLVVYALRHVPFCPMWGIFWGKLGAGSAEHISDGLAAFKVEFSSDLVCPTLCLTITHFCLFR